MKTLKKIFALIAIISFFNNSAGAQEIQKRQDLIEVAITRKTSQEELEKAVKYLEENAITMTIHEVKYNGAKRIKYLKGEIDSHDGHSGSFETVKSFKQIRIIRDSRPEAKKPFEILFN
jgi:hypothetical protein